MSGRAIAIAAMILTGSLSGGPPTQAQTVPPSSSRISGCVLRGMADPRINANIEDRSGRVIARFSGAPTALVLSQFPTDRGGRVRVETGTGTGSFRVRGFTPVRELPLHTTVNVPVIAGHVWIAANRDVSFLASARGRIRIEKQLSSPFAQTFSTWASCNALALASTPPSVAIPPGEARAYAFKGTTLELFDEPEGKLLISLRRAPDSEGALFFGTDESPGWLRVLHQGHVLVDAWARARDLIALPRGETMDQLEPHRISRNPARLAVQGEPRIVRSLEEVPLRAAAKEAEAPIGVVERGTETYVLEIVAGWASVMPKALNVVPAPDGQFWVKASELGI